MSQVKRWSDLSQYPVTKGKLTLWFESYLMWFKSHDLSQEILWFGSHLQSQIPKYVVCV